MILSRIKNIPNKISAMRFRRRFASIGKHSFVNPNSQLVPENMYIDDYVLVQDHTNFISLYGKLFIKKYSVISSGCIIVPSPHRLKVGVPFYVSAQYHIGDENEDIVIEEDCWIGAGAILLPGITIRRGSVIGAGAVVTKDTFPYSVSVGVPAKVIATKFSLFDCLQHESLIYDEKDRMGESELRNLFLTKYDNLPTIGNSNMSKEEEMEFSPICKMMKLNRY